MPLCKHGKAIYPDVNHLLMSPETGLVLKLGIAAGDCIAVSDIDPVILPLRVPFIYVFSLLGCE